MKTHLTWSVEVDGKCPYCFRSTHLIIAPTFWHVGATDGEAEVDDEVSGHYCTHCQCLTSLSLNTLDWQLIRRAAVPGGEPTE